MKPIYREIEGKTIKSIVQSEVEENKDGVSYELLIIFNDGDSLNLLVEAEDTMNVYTTFRQIQKKLTFNN